jgi:hypothetical protein
MTAFARKKRGILRAGKWTIFSRETRGDLLANATDLPLMGYWYSGSILKISLTSQPAF